MRKYRDHRNRDSNSNDSTGKSQGDSLTHKNREHSAPGEAERFQNRNFASPAANRHSHSVGRNQHDGEHHRTTDAQDECFNISERGDSIPARNAHFNLRVLGTRVTEYLVNHYGPMDDGVNRGDETDRIMVSWALAAPPVPTPEDDRVVASVAVPHDIETLRRESPTDAAAWRLRVREEMLGSTPFALMSRTTYPCSPGAISA